MRGIRIVGGIAMAALLPPLATAASAAAAASPPPVLGRSFDVSTVSGRVYVIVPGGRRATLTRARQVPVGTTLDASSGEVRLTAADTGGAAPYSGQFSRGSFQAFQSRTGDGTTRIVVVGACSPPKAASDQPAAVIARKPKPNIRRFLDITANGKFVVVGRTAQAIETGAASWSVVDQCDGSTRISDRHGRVAASSGALQDQLAAGEYFVAACRGSQFCEVVLWEPSANLFSFGLGFTRRPPARSYEVCIRHGTRTVSCRTAAVMHSAGGYLASRSCTLDSLPAGVYTAVWRQGSKQLGIPLRFDSVHAPDPAGTTNSCT